MINLLIQRQLGNALFDIANQVDKTLQCAAGSCRQHLFAQAKLRGGPEGAALFAGDEPQLLDRARANAASRRIDNAFQCGVVIPVHTQAKVGESIADFQTVVEALATVDTVGQSGADQVFFQHPGLGVAAIENGGVTTGKIAATGQAVDALGDKARLILFVKAGVDLNRVAFLALAPEFLAEAVAVVGNHGVGGFQNSLG